MKIPAPVQAFLLFFSILIVAAPLHAQVPAFFNYQGRVSVGGTSFTGTGGFEFAIVNSGASTTYWSSGSSEVSVPVSQGVYSVLIGDAAITNMASLSGVNFTGNTNLYLRVWFDDGVHGLQLLSPDQQLSSVPFAFEAQDLARLTTSDSISSVHLDKTGYITLTSVSDISLDPGSGNVFVGSSPSAGSDLSVSGNVYASNIVYSSDRDLKEKFAPVNSIEVLKAVAALPITSWNFKTAADKRHIGPMAQDFYSAFGVGLDAKHIGVGDEGGVALAAIQGLNAELQEKDAEIKDLERRLAQVEAKLNQSTNSAGGTVKPASGGVK